ncbi:MAG: ABC transporter permease [Gammaproteobacteria bacterium]|jgi:methyl-accepting chemotaxis protein|nr:ABC transporter permease [Gammaproteobacteria bacterium]MBT7308825.1 ABC transporter permease [Gammaproteobacteria bacterium]
MGIVQTSWLMAGMALVASIFAAVVSEGSVVSLLLVAVTVGVLIVGLRALKADQAILEKMEHVAVDANRGILESRVTHIPVGHRYEECAWAINEMMDQTETVFRDVSTTLNRMVVGDYGRHPQPVGLRGLFPEILVTVDDVQERVKKTMDSLAHVMAGLGDGDLGVRMGDDVEALFRDQVNGAMVSIDEVLKQFGEIVKQLEQGDCSGRVELDGVKGDLHQLGVNINQSMEFFGAAVTETVMVAERMKGGDLTARIEGEFRGMLRTLKESINTTQAKFAEIVGSVRTSATGVNSNALEVSNGSQDLASRTAEQAASLEQTAASMEQISSTVNLSADNAVQASQLAEDSVHHVTEGTSVISRAVEAMEGINESSSKISEIISLIDGIAFQTNLLALNAAVEAARAGEHGRGFAVVAGEVRSLAQRSADAAKDIKGLIENSSIRIEEGSRLVGESGKSLDAIQNSIKKMNDIAREIALSAKEQTQGIEQVNSAVTQLDSVTQENAALVEETAASSEHLSRQADQLSEMVSFFDVGVLKTAPAEPSARVKKAGKAAPVTMKKPPKAQLAKRSAVATPSADSEWAEF